ncbi:hypothetical protein [Aeromicrobium sp. UC242_57]|uniref:hypothetical protein n=1 Tax=Aeromicrobium sp. UC242_57 TaxID=3374624 RepID=UPI0037A9387E
MHFDEPGWALIDDFFAQLARRRSAATVRRYVRVHQRLTAFLDTADMTLGLGEHRARLLDAEREFHDSGAFCTLYGTPELVQCLPSFLHETWLPAGLTESRMHVSVCARLLDHVVRERAAEAVISPTAVADATRAISQARLDIEAAAADVVPRAPKIPPRLLRQPGPEW